MYCSTALPMGTALEREEGGELDTGGGGSFLPLSLPPSGICQVNNALYRLVVFPTVSHLLESLPGRGRQCETA